MIVVVAGAAAGAGVGCLVAVVEPAYYPFALQVPTADPVRLGFVHGLVEGMLVGTGLAAVWIIGAFLASAVGRPWPGSAAKPEHHEA